MSKLDSQKEKGKNLTSENQRLVPLCDVAEILSVDERTVRRHSQLGELPPIIKLGHLSRMKLHDVLEYINRLGGSLT